VGLQLLDLRVEVETLRDPIIDTFESEIDRIVSSAPLLLQLF
jgi:hypothetical protein